MLESKDIDGEVYEVDLFSTTEGIKLWVQLQKILGPGLASLLEGGQTEFKDTSLGDVVEKLVGGMEEDQTTVLIKKLLSKVKRGGNDVSLDYEMFFRGKYLTLCKVILFVIEQNFFFGKDIFQSINEKFDQLSKYQSTSKIGPESTP